MRRIGLLGCWTEAPGNLDLRNSTAIGQAALEPRGGPRGFPCNLARVFNMVDDAFLPSTIRLSKPRISIYWAGFISVPPPQGRLLTVLNGTFV